MTFVQAMLLAVLQGVSELFPVSSLGHTVLVPALLRWNVDESSESFLAFVVVLHLGTALALIVFYRRDWIAIVRALVASIVRGRLSNDPDERTAWLLIAGTIPVGILGVLFQSAVKSLFASPIPVSLFLLANGFLMLFGEWLRKRQHPSTSSGPTSSGPTSPEPTSKRYRRLEKLTPREGVFVGVMQSLALLPGISRSGSAIVAGLLRDLHHDAAARYSFLLATPVGPALDEHRMNIRDLAPALVAIADLFSAANTELNGNSADVRVEVKGNFKSGSFQIELIFTQALLVQLRDMFASSTATAVSNASAILAVVGLVGGGGLIGFLRQLRGRRPEHVEDNGESFSVWMTETEVMEVSRPVFRLYKTRAVRVFLQKALSPLELEGVTSFGVVRGNDTTWTSTVSN